MPFAGKISSLCLSSIGVRGRWSVRLRSTLLACAVVAQLARAADAPTVAPVAQAPVERTELARVLDRLLASPAIKTAPGYRADILVPPGQLYDPLYFVSRGDGAWIADDGGEEGDKGGRIVAIDRAGKTEEVVHLGVLLPVLAFDVAPGHFGERSGQIIAMTQARTGDPGTRENHQLVALSTEGKTDREVKTICVLPTAGRANGGISGWGADAKFGPPSSPFAGRFFAVTAFNNMIYQLDSAGECRPFAEMPPPYGVPLGIAFASNGASMLVSVQNGDAGVVPAAGKGAILSIDPDGTVRSRPVLSGLTRPAGIAIAPSIDGGHGGRLFFTEIGGVDFPVKPTQPEKNDGTLLRVGDDGKIHTVATGFQNPLGLHVMGDRLWVSDIAGDFMGGGRELPDGFIVEVRAAKVRR